MGLLATLGRIADALERIANRPSSDPQDAAKLVAALEAKLTHHLVAHQDAIAALRERSPPEADLVRRMCAVEFESQKAVREVNSFRSKVNRDGPKARRAEDGPPLVGFHGASMAPQLEPEAPNAE